MLTYRHRWSMSALMVASSFVAVGVAGVQPAIASGSSWDQSMGPDTHGRSEGRGLREPPARRSAVGRLWSWDENRGGKVRHQFQNDSDLLATLWTRSRWRRKSSKQLPIRCRRSQRGRLSPLLHLTRSFTKEQAQGGLIGTVESSTATSKQNFDVGFVYPQWAQAEVAFVATRPGVQHVGVLWQAASGPGYPEYVAAFKQSCRGDPWESARGGFSV